VAGSLEGLIGGSWRKEEEEEVVEEGVEGQSLSPFVGEPEKLLELLCRLKDGVVLLCENERGCEEEGVAQNNGIFVGEGVRQNMLEFAEGEGGSDEVCEAAEGVCGGERVGGGGRLFATLGVVVEEEARERLEGVVG